MGRLTRLKSIKPAQAQRLAAIGVVNTDQLLQAGAKPAGRERLAETGGIPLIGDMSSDIASRPLDYTKFDMFYAGAQKNLGPAGVNTLVELSRRNPEILRQRLAAINQTQRLVRRLPAENDVWRWVDQAGRLSQIVTY